MKFEIKREALLRPLSQVTGVVEKRQTLPVLANLLLSARGQELTITGTDLEVELVATVMANVSDGGEVTVPARKLFDICKALPDGSDITLDIGSERGTVQAGRSRFVLATLPANDFPVIEDVDVNETVSVDAYALQTIIERTAFAMANQDVRYYLNGLLLELANGQIRAVATDGHRLAIADTEVDLSLESTRRIIVPRKGVLELQRLLNDHDGDVEIQLGRNHVRLNIGSSRFTSKLIDGQFPDYEAVIPPGADQIIIAERESLKLALQRTAILSNEKFRGVKLEVSPNRLRLVAHNPEQEEAVEELEVQTESDRLAVGFNVNYLMDALNAVEGENVQVALRDANSSCLISAEDSSRARHVVMPLRL